MIWIAILLLSAAAFAFAVLALGLPRASWTLLGAGMMFGLAGYAAQGSPDQPSSPQPPAADRAQDGASLVDLRRAFFSSRGLPSRFVVTADAFARQGRFENAARFLDNALRDNPQEAEAWVALGNALVEHAEGQLGPAALLAYQRAREAAPTNPAPLYFTGWAWLRAGEPERTLVLWRQTVAEAPEGAPWLAAVQLQLARLEALNEAMQGRPGPAEQPGPLS